MFHQLVGLTDTAISPVSFTDRPHARSLRQGRIICEIGGAEAGLHVVALAGGPVIVEALRRVVFEIFEW